MCMNNRGVELSDTCQVSDNFPRKFGGAAQYDRIKCRKNVTGNNQVGESMSYERAALPLTRSFLSEEYDGLGLRHILVMPIVAASVPYQ